MATNEATAETTGNYHVAVDAFGFWPEYASRIEGLGGRELSPDPAYAFHSAYLELEPGHANATVNFRELDVGWGAIAIRVNALPDGDDARATTIGTWSFQFSQIAADGGIAAFSFNIEEGNRYAILGHIYGDTDATAEGLDIMIDVRRGSSVEAERPTMLKSSFGQRMFRRAQHMLGIGRATLADPVSQTCTARQFEEPEYAEILERLKTPLHRHRKQWEFVYILRVLERYGMLLPDAHGLGFGVGIEPLPAAMAAAGCYVTATDLAATDERARDWAATNQLADNIDFLRHPEICPNDVFDAHVAFRPVDMNAIPGDLRDFDFTWSSCALEHLGSIEAGLDFIRNSVGCLKAGGLAVHTTELNLSSNEETLETGGTVLFRRRDLERLALDLVSRGHYVAQLKFDLGTSKLDQHIDVAPYSDDNHLKLALADYVTTSFGIIVRRGDR